MELSIYTTLPPKLPKVIFIDFPEMAKRHKAFGDLVGIAFCDIFKKPPFE